MYRINSIIHIFLLLAFGCYTDIALAQTGSHITGSPHNAPETVVWFSEPREITDIRLLLQAGKKQEAIELARKYMNKLQGIAGLEAQVFRYYGLNALCAALTSAGQLHEAIENCSRAIKMFPKRWQALNNRAVAYYISGQTELALQDYNLALSQVQESKPLAELIQHNIDLVNAKKAGTGQ